MKNRHLQDCEDPLCAFCVSAAFFIKGVSALGKTQPAPSGQHFISFPIPSCSRPSFGRINRQTSYSSFTELFNTFERRKNLSLEEILEIVQNVWKESERQFCISTTFDSNMDSRSNIYSPTLQRRRLSVPETIMRKHNLSLERTPSQELKQYEKDVDCCSDPNLARKKDYNVMRKSTLLRRLWGDSSKTRLSGSFQEWQHSYKKISSTQSLNSNHSSPEHSSSRKSPGVRKKFSSSPNRFSSTKSLCEDQSVITNSPKRRVKHVSLTPISRESTCRYSMSTFTNVQHSESNPDSAYSNSFSNFTSTPSGTNDEENNIKSTHETGVQTSGGTNLNVISNVNLSQSTLDVIFKEVMKDVTSMSQEEVTINTATVNSEMDINKDPGLHFDSNFNPTDNLENFIISKVRVGTPYTKPVEICPNEVPRFSAVPRTSSMEVNTSEEDKEGSDSASYVDSLEEFTPRNVELSDVEQLLPEGKKELPSKMSSSFFIPIETTRNIEVKSVSELLPHKMKERLMERQQQREEKLRQYRHSTPATTSKVRVIKNSLNQVNYLPKKKTKPVLPGIASLKNSNSDTTAQHIRKKPPLRKTETTPKSSQTGKRIEIMKIVECVDIPDDRNKKSKIPVPVGSHKTDSAKKPAYLDLDNNPTSSDSKLDQLIANILIDSLHHDEETENHPQNSKQVGSIDVNKNLIGAEKSSIPKGWVTVYTVHKDMESPESTSDEGRKDLVEIEKLAEDGVNQNRNKKTQEDQISQKVSQGCDKETSTRPGPPSLRSYVNQFEDSSRSWGKNEEQKNSLGEWSVTISGTNNYGQMAPDVEMRLKFPKKHYRSSSTSTFGKENNDDKCTFPKIHKEEKLFNTERRYLKDKLKQPEENNLPKIQTSRSRLIKRESSLLSMSSSVLMPRQNKTSTSRYYFSRPRERYSLPEVPPVLNGRQYYEIMKHIPDILSVSGRSISPERRPFEGR